MKTQERIRAIQHFLFIGVFLFLSFTIHAANAPVVSFGSACNAVVGQTITIPVVVSNFNNISGFTLAVDYDYSKLHCEIASSNYSSSLGGTCNIGEVNLGNGFRRLKISWYKDGATGITLPNGSAVANYVFTYVSGPADLKWFDNGPSCVFTDPNATVLNDSPTSSYYLNGLVSTSCSTIPTITANGPTSFCEGGSVELTASAGTAYKWSPGGATTRTINATTSGNYTVEVTDASGAKATSEPTVVTVTPGVVAEVSIAASINPVCAGQEVTFTATPTNGGSNPAYQWKVNNLSAGSNSPTLKYNPADWDVVSCEMVSNEACVLNQPAYSGNITMHTNQPKAVSVDVYGFENPVCAGKTVSFTAYTTNGGETPAFQWKVNGTNLGTNSANFSYVPANNDEVSCVLTSSETCTTGNPATWSGTMTVNPVKNVSVSIVATATTVCANQQVTLTATPVNGGLNPGYMWLVNGTNKITDSNTFTYVPTDQDVVICRLYSSETCYDIWPAESNAITLNVTPLKYVGIWIEANSNNVCSGTSVSFQATPTNEGTNPVYQWKVNDINAGSNSPLFSYVPANGDQVTCELTSSIACAHGVVTSSPVTMAVNPVVPVSVSIAASQNPVCPNTRVEFTATPTNGGASPAYQWKVNGEDAGTNNVLFAFYPVNSDVVTCVLTSNAACISGSPATSDAITMEVGSAIEPSVSLTADPSGAVCEGTSVTFTATPAGGGDSPKYYWSKNGVSLGDLGVSYSYVPLNGDEIQVGIQSSATCAGSNVQYSDPIKLTVNPKLPVSVSVSATLTEVCAGTPVTFTATPANEGTAPQYKWLVNNVEKGNNSFEYSYTPENGDMISCVLTSSEACVSGNPATSNLVTMIVNPILEATVSISAVPSEAVVAGTSVTFTASPVYGGLSPSYQWKVNGEDKGINNPEYSFVPNHGDVVSCVMTSNATGCISGSPANSNEIVVPVISTGTTVLSYRFANPRILKISGTDRFEFDVELKADVSGTEFLKGKVNLNFNNSTLSTNVADWIATPVSGSVTDLSVSGAILNIELDGPGSLAIGTTYQKLITISGKITNGTGEAGIDFNEGNMNGKQLCKLAISPGMEFYLSPNLYDEADFVNTWVGRVYAIKYGWTQMVALNFATPVNTSIWEGHAGLYDLYATNMRIHKAALLSIPSDGKLSVSGNTDIIPENGLIIESDANGTGSLITGTSSGSAAVQRYMTTDAWHIVASPVSGQSISGFLASNPNVAEDVDDASIRGMMDYNPAINDWKAYFTNSTVGDLETGKGFSIRTDANSAVTFTGTLQSGNLTVSGLAPALWNCIGNPYTSAIGINESSVSSANFLTENADQLDPSFGAIYVWHNGDENNGIWGNYTIISNAPDFGNDAAFDVQQGQAYMVKMNTSATSVSFNPDMQIHNPELELKSTKGIWSIVKLNAAISNQKSSTTIAFNNGMTKGLDPTYDAGLLRGGSDLVLYSKLVEDNGIPFAIQALPGDDFSNLIIPIGIESKTGGELVFSSENMNLPATCQLILEDKLSKTFTDLSINEYTTTIAANTNGSDRFRIHTSYLTTKLGNGSLLDNLSAYAVRNVEIRLKGEVSKQAIATLYDLQGKTVLVKTLEEGSLNIIQTPNIKTAVYMLSVQDNGKTARFKIPVNE